FSGPPTLSNYTISLHDALPILRRLTDAAHRAGMPVWGHAWVQPASVMDQVLSEQDGVVHAAGLAGELFTPAARDTLVHEGDLQRSEEHTSELQSRENLVCRLLL